MVSHIHADPAAMQAAVGRAQANLEDQVSNQTRMLGTHEGTRAGFFGMAARGYETKFVSDDGRMTVTGEDHRRINEADQFTVNSYSTADENNLAKFNAAINT